MPRFIRIVSLLIFIASLGLFALPSRVLDLTTPARAAATFNVNWPGDEPDSDTSDGVCIIVGGGNRCSLRAAIQQANATAGTDNIVVFPTGTITLASPLPDLSTDMNISVFDGRRPNVSGAGAFRVFNVPNGATVSISGLIISGGRAGFGSGITNSGTLTLSDCVLTNNVSTNAGGGLSNSGSLTVTNSTFAYNSSNQGGGLYNVGGATLTNVTVSSNTSGMGGGIANVGPLTLSGVTVIRNRAQTLGGGIHNPGIGMLHFGDTVFAGNSAGTSGPDMSGANLISEDYNLVENTSDADISGARAHNITGVAPSLGPLRENGARTPTHAPLPGSALVDQGKSALATDQRGRTRPVNFAAVADASGGDGSDIGAFELQAAEYLVVNSLLDTSDGQCDAQDCTLREAVGAANASADHNTILFGVAGTINLTGALPAVATDMTIEGPGAKSLTVKRNTAAEYRIFTVAENVRANISGLTLTGGQAPSGEGGGAVSNSGTLTLDEVAIVANKAVGGGGVYNPGTLTVLDSTLSGNNANIGGGGAIFSSNKLTVLNSTISGNTVGSGSGAVFLLTGFADFFNSTISNNGERGIVSLGGATPTLTSCIIANNISVTPNQELEGEFFSFGYNLVEAPGSAVINDTANPGTNIIGQDPKLGPLQDNGGPTQTHALAPDSPALDKGRAVTERTVLAVIPAAGNFFRDQRGVARPYDFASTAPAAGGDNSDIGAFELRPVAETPASKATNEDAAVSFTFFAGDQTVTSVSATSSDQALVPDANISVTGSGPERTILITPAPDRYGSATITVSINGSNEGAVTRTFRLTVNPVNDAPSFNKGGDQTVLEDAGPQTVSNWAAGVSPGPFEGLQTVGFVVTDNTNPSLFSAAPSVGPNGTLTYTPAPDANGSATVTVVLKDNGGTLIGGQDTSAAQSFVINVTAVNDAPVASGQTIATDEDTPKSVTLVATDVENDALTFAVVSGPSRGTLTGTGAARTYTPAADFNGTDSFTFKATDTSNADSNVATVTINVAAVNDAPVNFVPGAQVTARNTALVFSPVNSNAVYVYDVDAGGNPVRVTLTASNGVLTLGRTSGLTFSAGDGSGDATMTFTGTLSNVEAALDGLTYTPTAGFEGAASVQITTDDQGFTGSGGAKSDTDSVAINVARSTVEFSQVIYTGAERAGSLSVTVRRQGDASQAASVDYATDDGSTPSTVVDCSSVNFMALERCDYTKALGTLRFAAGETEKTILILISDDSYTEATETAHVTLGNASVGLTVGPRASTLFEITDDLPESNGNPVDDSAKFVRQHYHDFLNREPDAEGLAFWTNEIEKCGTGTAEAAQCRDVRRINVSAAFFLAIEFQQTGYLVERMYKAAYGDATGISTIPTPHQIPVPIVRRSEFLADSRMISGGVVVGRGDWERELDSNKTSFALAFVQRQRFADALPPSMTAGQFVDKLFSNAGVTPTAAERDAAVSAFGAGGASGRAAALRRVAESGTFDASEKNRAFVLMQFFGYLQRDPDAAPNSDHTGYQFWLDKLNAFNGNFVAAEMVKAFLSSDEYRHRFGQ